jgi:hypothetical protein
MFKFKSARNYYFLNTAMFLNCLFDGMCSSICDVEDGMLVSSLNSYSKKKEDIRVGIGIIENKKNRFLSDY